jgi:hypothetical protein
VVEAALSAARRRRGVLVVWLVLVVLVGLIAAVEYRDRLHAASRTPGETDARMLLPVPVDQLGAIEVADAGRLHRFERDAAGVWLYHGVHTGAEGSHVHTADPQLAERIARTMAAFGRTRLERQFPLGRDGADYGVTTPDVVVLVYRPSESQPLAQYAVGHVAPDTVSRYVLVVGRPVVATIPGYQVDNLLALVRSLGATADGTPASARRP